MMTKNKNKKNTLYILYPIHYNSCNEKYYIVTDSKNNLVHNIHNTYFRSVAGFNLKSKLRGSSHFKNRNFSYLTAADIYEISEQIQQSETTTGRKEKTNNNYKYLNKCSTEYPAGTNLYASGLFSQLKTQFHIKKVIQK